MSQPQQSRRDFLKTSTAALAAGSMPYWFTGTSAAAALNYRSANERPILGCIGTGDRWNAVGPNAMQFGDCVAVCDVDREHMEKGRKVARDRNAKKGADRDVEMYEDYRKLLDRSDIDVVTIVTPDHWHSKIAIEALQAGKDVYCEKPLTLTIHEGKQIIKVLRETNRVFQVGTQQRSEMGHRFVKAVAMIHEGRLGKIRKVQCAIGGAPTSGPIPVADVPSQLNWDMWLGQTPLVEYRSKPSDGRYPKSRAHYDFRWWYEYSGGKMTDWGAHHVDIAQWALRQDGEGQGPRTIEPVSAEHPVPLKDGRPTRDDAYNTATGFYVKCLFDDDVEFVIRHDTENGITFEGEKGKMFVSRGSLEGQPVDDLRDNPLPDDALVKVWRGHDLGDPDNAHMRNFFDCVKSRELPISDVYSHHRAMTTCHLANIAIRLGRKLRWDPQVEQIVGDREANAWLAREQRKPYEIDVSV